MGRFERWLASAAAWLVRGDFPQHLRASMIWITIGSPMSRGPVGRVFDRMVQATAMAAGELALNDPDGFAALAQQLRRLGGEPYLIVGDSHSRLYVHRGRRGSRWLFPVHHLATGSSARGLGNPRSRSGQGGIVADLVRRTAAPTLFVFGQVDVEFIYVFKQMEGQVRPSDQGFLAFCEEGVQAYVHFLRGLGAPESRAVAAVFPPALSDQAWRDGYVNAHLAELHSSLDPETLRRQLRALPIPGIRERTEQHRSFNRILGAEAARAGLGWVNLFDRLLSGDGQIAPEFLGPAGGRDHHLDHLGVRPVVRTAIWEFLHAA